MHKIMLVIDGEMERKFLAKIMQRLGFQVLSSRNSKDMASNLAESFPDIVFASIIGKSSSTLTSLAKLKAAKGIPKVVFVRNSKDTKPLTAEQKSIVDGLLYSPIDPFKLLEILAKTTGIDLATLKHKYRELVMGESGGDAPEPKNKAADRGFLIVDKERKQKYDHVVAELKEKNKDHAEFNPDRFRELQKAQSKNSKEDPGHRALKKNFIKTLFSVEPKERKG